MGEMTGTNVVAGTAIPTKLGLLRLPSRGHSLTTGSRPMPEIHPHAGRVACNDALEKRLSGRRTGGFEFPPSIGEPTDLQ